MFASGAHVFLAILVAYAGGVDAPANTPPCMRRLHPTKLCAPDASLLRKVTIA